jgi:hypothetical protein
MVEEQFAAAGLKKYLIILPEPTLTSQQMHQNV